LPHIGPCATALNWVYEKTARVSTHLAAELRELQVLGGLEWQSPRPSQLDSGSTAVIGARTCPLRKVINLQGSRRVLPRCRIGAHAVSQDREREAVQTALLCTVRPQMVRARLQHVLVDTGALVRDGACSITAVAGEAPIGGRSRSRGPSARRWSDERRGGAGAHFVGAAAVGAAEKRGPQFPGMCRVCARPGWPDYAVLVSRTESADG
jgi:hypothetical protein